MLQSAVIRIDRMRSTRLEVTALPRHDCFLLLSIAEARVCRSGGIRRHDYQQCGTVHEVIVDELLDSSDDFGRRDSRCVEQKSFVRNVAVGVVISSMLMMGWMCRGRNPAKVERDCCWDCVI
jgi:hypothetical protein